MIKKRLSKIDNLSIYSEIYKRYLDRFLRNSKIYIGIFRPTNELKYILCDFSWKNIKTEVYTKTIFYIN